jgi:ethanolamine utilization microcompartment shell protein EutS
LTTTTVGILTITPSSIALVDSSFVFVSVFR